MSTLTDSVIRASGVRARTLPHPRRSEPRSEGGPRRPRGFRRLASATAAVLLAAAAAPLLSLPAHAALAGVGPVDPDSGYPTWFSDGNVKLSYCVDPANGCLAELPQPEEPVSYPANFPEEAFWFAAEASEGNLRLYEAALEGAHANGVVRAGDQMGFGRLRFRINNLVPNETYTITHPYGIDTFVAEQDPKVATRGLINETIDAGSCAPTLARPCDWAGVGDAFLGDNAATTTSAFIRQVGAAPGTLGDINTPRAVTGAPSGTNAVIVDGPNAGGSGINTLRVNNFTVQGLIFDGADGAPTTPDLAAASDSGRSNNDNLTKDASPTFTGTVPGVTSATSVEFVVDGVLASASTTSTDATGAYAVTLASLAPGVHRLQARILDPATPADAPPRYLTSGTLSFTVDTAAPAVSVVAPFPSNPSADHTPTLNFTGEAGATFECQLLPSNADWEPGCVSPKVYDEQLNGTYTFNVRATDAAGNVSTPAGRTWTIGEVDAIAPSVTSRTPAGGATGVAVTSNVTATFSEPVSGVSGTTFTLRSTAGTAVPAAVTYNATTRIATLDPTASLAAGTSYTATLTGGASAIRDSAGNALGTTSWTFTTAAAVPPNAAPTVTTRAPAANATGVSQTGDLSATFNEAVTGVSSTSFTLRTAAGSAVAATVSYNATTRVATLNPTTNLAADTRYTATLTGGAAAIRDTGTPSAPLVTTTWSFTSGPRPTVSTRAPAVNGTAASQTADITATFNEAVTGVSGASFTLRTAAGTAVPATVTYSATTRVARLNPTANLAADTRYTATLTGSATAIRDAAGNPLTTTSWRFLTGPRPTISSRTPASGAVAVSRTANVTAAFSENVTGASGTTFVLRNAATGASVPAVVTYSATTRVATLNPSVTLAARTRYTATVTGGTGSVRDVAGNPLTTATWSFTTGA